MSDTVPFHIPIDNAAQIFISNYSKKETTMSRVALTLKNPVDKERLESALKTIIKRFPVFQVYLKNRFFNFFLERTDDIPEIENDTEWPNKYVDFKNKKFLFRIKVKSHTLAVECSHILSDGFGTMSFLFSLIAEYLKLEGIIAGESVFIKKIEDQIVNEEWECAYRKLFSREGPSLSVPKPAYFPRAEAISEEKYFNTRIIMDLETMRNLSKKHKVTLNVYMSAVYTLALQEMYLEEGRAGRVKLKKPIRLEIPVNLRKDYPTTCLRNFSYIYSPEFDLRKKEYSFEEIIRKIAEDIIHERHSGSIEKHDPFQISTEYIQTIAV